MFFSHACFKHGTRLRIDRYRTLTLNYPYRIDGLLKSNRLAPVLVAYNYFTKLRKEGYSGFPGKVKCLVLPTALGFCIESYHELLDTTLSTYYTI